MATISWKECVLSEWLTKSKLLSAHQCRKRLWLEVHEPGLADQLTGSQTSIRIGQEVGEFARSLYPGGTLIGHVSESDMALSQTQVILSKHGPTTLYEAAFAANGALTRTDILQRDARGRLRLVEVKASTSVKDVHLLDCAIQVGILALSGTRVDSVFLAHIDSSFIYHGNGDYRGLLKETDVTIAIEDTIGNITESITTAGLAIKGEMPDTVPGAQCTSPYPCPYYKLCNKAGPEYPISILPGKRAEKLQLLEDGYIDVRQIPEGYLSNTRAEWIRGVTVSGDPDLKPEAGAALEDLPFPRYYLDFETVGPAIPIWEGTKPYEALPFQWSCHVELESGEMRHQEFLASGSEAPMRRCAESLLESLGKVGPIFMYSNYERTVIRGLAEGFEDLAPDLLALIPRLVDLLPITKAHYYHPDLKGSWSIKSVLTTITFDLGYDRLSGIQEGLGASQGYLEMISPETSLERKAQLKSELLEYCRLDTYAMVKLAHFLSRRKH